MSVGHQQTRVFSARTHLLVQPFLIGRNGVSEKTTGDVGSLPTAQWAAPGQAPMLAQGLVTGANVDGDAPPRAGLRTPL